MGMIDIKLDGDACWPDLATKQVIATELRGLALLPDGIVVRPDGSQHRMPIVTLRVDLPDGSVALAQVKLDVLHAAVRGMQGHLEYLAAQRAAGKAEA